MSRKSRRHDGFTFIEVLVVLVLLMVLMVFAFPAIQGMVRRGKIEGTARQTSVLLQSARLAALKAGGQKATTPLGATSWSARTVVRVDPATREVVAFVDVNDSAGSPGSDLVFNPVAGENRGDTDTLLGRVSLPNHVLIDAPDGLTAGADGVPIAVFLSDGSIDRSGAFRFSDRNGNRLEVRIEPRATARVELRKWDAATNEWLTNGQRGKQWSF
jgi:prepilin-type N-terminal cleavage/methylation domain-containing protein